MSRKQTSPSTLDLAPTALRAKKSGRAATPRGQSGGNAQPGPGGVVSHAIRVLCVDDHAVLVEGLKVQFAIDAGIEVVGRLGSAVRLVEEVRRHRPDAVLLDIEMPGPDAFEMADRLRHTLPEVRVIVLSAHIRDGFISAAFTAGVSGYFAKTDELEDIVGGIREVMRGRADGFVLGPKVRERCRHLPTRAGGRTDSAMSRHDLTVMRTGAPLTLLASLTPRELEVLRLIGKGLSRTQIAAQLCRSVKTIDAHQDRMMKKLGIAARAELMRFAIREGLAQA
ncbi:MAG: response regulator transcription factor [Phycisphaerales bacterium]|nr:response regulator transcription factor [Phycisphaerales bacterium]